MTQEAQQDEPRLVALEPTTVAMVRETIAMSQLPVLFDRAFDLVMEELQAQGVDGVGAPVGVYYAMPAETADVGGRGRRDSARRLLRHLDARATSASPPGLRARAWSWAGRCGRPT